MNGDFDLFGIFVPSLLVWMVLAYALSKAGSSILAKYGAYRFIWHRPLFDLATYVFLLGALVTLLDR